MKNIISMPVFHTKNPANRFPKKTVPKRLFVSVMLLCLLLTFGACAANDRLNEGDCAGTITFSNIPKEFSMLEDNIREQFEISVELENLTTEKKYHITLSPENNFRQDLSLHPGTYRVLYLSCSQSGNLGLKLEASAETMTFEKGRQAMLLITVSNPEEFTNHWMEVQPLPEILLADQYSGMIQINRKVIPISEIFSELKIGDSAEEDVIDGFQTATLTDSEKGITVSLLNPTGGPLPWSRCKVTEIKVSKNTVVFPDGVTIGTAPSKVCHRTTGLYGEPTKISGFMLFGWDLDSTTAVYNDSVTGNRITLHLNAKGTAITGIEYALEVFE